MAKIYMEPEDFESLIESLDSSRLGLDVIRCRPDTKGLKLNCVDGLIDCINLLNTAIFGFVSLQKYDVDAMEKIKLDFLHVDKDGKII